MNDIDFNNLLESVQQAGQIKQGLIRPARTFEISPVGIKKIRADLHKSQREFALMIGVGLSTLQNWEQGRRRPHGPARALLRVASRNPSIVEEALTH